jgi:hypothetical protein
VRAKGRGFDPHRPYQNIAESAALTHLDLRFRVRGGAGCLEIRRADGSRSRVLTIARRLPRNGGKFRLVICPRCQWPRRALYAWKLDPSRPHAVFASTWQCRLCAGLRYASEGGALVSRSRTSIGRQIEELEGPLRRPRPEPSYPYGFASPQQAADAGFCRIA